MAKDNTFSGMAHNALTAETTIVGKIVSQKDIRIDGTLEGRLECQGKVVIGETGQVIGDIVAVNAEVVGRITGNVNGGRDVGVESDIFFGGRYTGSTVGDRARSRVERKVHHVAAAR